MIKCIIFDCDGTLVDSEHLCNLGFELLLKEYGVTSSATKMAAEFRGEKLANILKTIENRHAITLKESFVKSYRSTVNDLFEKHLKAFDGVFEALNNLEELICVASSGPLEKIHNALSITGLSAYFKENTFSSYNINSWKPEPDIFIHAAKEMGVQAHECLVIEDSLIGITAAKRAGMRGILYDPENRHSNISVRNKITHMNQLKERIYQYKQL